MTQINPVWVKLWTKALTDIEMDNLAIADFGRWAKLLLYAKLHGSGGELHISEPARAFCNSMQVQSLNEFKKIAETFPNLTISCNGKNGVTIFKIHYWHKYQIDDSSARVAKYRKGVTVQEEEEDKNKNKNKTKTKNKEKESIKEKESSITPRLKLPDEEWIQTLKENPAYKGIEIDVEHGKCLAWFQNKGIVVSRQRFLNWLNRAERPLKAKKPWEE